MLEDLCSETNLPTTQNIEVDYISAETIKRALPAQAILL